MADDFGLASGRPRNRPPTTRISVFRAAANWTFAPLDDFEDDDQFCGQACDHLGVPLRLAMFADSARPQPVGPGDQSEYQAAAAHFALLFSPGRCVSRGNRGAFFWCVGLLRGRARRDRMMCAVSPVLAAV